MLSPSFTEQMPELLAEQYVLENEKDGQKGGRAYIGQQYTIIDNEKIYPNRKRAAASGNWK